MSWLSAEYGDAPNSPPWVPLRCQAEEANDSPAATGSAARPSSAISVRNRSSWVVSSTRSTVAPLDQREVRVLERPGPAEQVVERARGDQRSAVQHHQV